MSRVFVDTTVFVLAQGREHPLQPACRRFLSQCDDVGTAVHASVEAVQEFTFHRLRARSRDQVLTEARRLRDSIVLHPFDDAVLDEALRLIEVSAVRGRDAVHAATALLAGFTEIVSADRDFELVPGLRRIAPPDWPDLTRS